MGYNRSAEFLCFPLALSSDSFRKMGEGSWSVPPQRKATMRKLKPEFLKKNGREFVLLTRADFKAFSEMIEDARDVLIVREAREQNKGAKGISIGELKRRLGLFEPRRFNRTRSG
jgi:hypothetical protein